MKLDESVCREVGPRVAPASGGVGAGEAPDSTGSQAPAETAVGAARVAGAAGYR